MTERRRKVDWYFSDWIGDPKVRALSLELRGAWIDLLAVMHDGTPYGYLADKKGRALTAEEVGRILGVRKAKAAKILAEIEGKGLVSRDDSGRLFSRRLVRDEAVRLARAAGGYLSTRHPNVHPRKGLPHLGEPDGPGTGRPGRAPGRVPSGGGGEGTLRGSPQYLDQKEVPGGSRDPNRAGARADADAPRAGGGVDEPRGTSEVRNLIDGLGRRYTPPKR